MDPFRCDRMIRRCWATQRFQATSAAGPPHRVYWPYPRPPGPGSAGRRTHAPRSSDWRPVTRRSGQALRSSSRLVIRSVQSRWPASLVISTSWVVRVPPRWIGVAVMVMSPLARRLVVRGRDVHAHGRLAQGAGVDDGRPGPHGLAHGQRGAAVQEPERLPVALHRHGRHHPVHGLLDDLHAHLLVEFAEGDLPQLGAAGLGRHSVSFVAGRHWPGRSVPPRLVCGRPHSCTLDHITERTVSNVPAVLILPRVGRTRQR